MRHFYSRRDPSWSRRYPWDFQGVRLAVYAAVTLICCWACYVVLWSVAG